jgi:putative DNA primase/helicase
VVVGVFKDQPSDENPSQEEYGEKKHIKLPKGICPLCKKYHTFDCKAESVDSIKTKNYVQNEKSEPISDDCFELDEKKVKDTGEIIELLTDIVLSDFTLKHFVKGGSSLGLYKWVNGRYVDCEEEVKAYVEGLGVKMGLRGKIKTHIVREVIEKCKRKTYHELGEEEPLRITFKNVVFDWKSFLSEKGKTSFIIPIEQTKDNPVFHLIPHELDVELLRKCICELDPKDGVKGLAEKIAPEVVKIFKDWVGDNWVLLFEIIGYCLYPSYPFNKAFMLVGDGSNGKSTFLNLIRAIVGEENVVNQSLQQLCNYPFAPAELYHKLVNMFPDLPSTPLKYTGLFKALTGEDYITAPRKFKTPITFKSYAKLIFSANELPEVSDKSLAFWRRWIVIDFPNTFPDNPTFFEEHFTKEAIEKIIALSIIAFANAWLNRGFSIEGEAEDFREKWLRRENSIYAYIKSGLEGGRIELNKDEYTPVEELYSDYRDWCDGEDRTPEEKATFTKELQRLFGINKKRIMELGRRFYVYVGVKLKEEQEEEAKEVKQSRLF